MSRAVVTGIGCVGPTGLGVDRLPDAMDAGRPLGSVEPVGAPRGRRREMRVARIAPFDREPFIPARKLRRMDEVSQVWTVTCMLALADAGLDDLQPDKALYRPEDRATFLGTGFGCVAATWEYLTELTTDGAAMANPFLFSESVANAPAGHSAIEMNARGPNCTLTCADASAVAAVAAGARSIQDGRAEMAVCGGLELLPSPAIEALAALGAPGFVGEGSVALILESLESARSRGARIHAEIAGQASASDPRCGSWEWSLDADRMSRVLTGAARRGGGRSVRKVFLHAGGFPPAEAAEDRAAAASFPGVPVVRPARVFGGMVSAAFSLALGVLDSSRQAPEESVVVSAWAWGGGLYSVALSGAPD